MYNSEERFSTKETIRIKTNQNKATESRTWQQKLTQTQRLTSVTPVMVI
jgi:hypothetical protein